VISYTWFKSVLNIPDSKYSLGQTWAPLAAGIFADISVNLLAVPSDVVVQRMQLKEYDYTSAWDACQKIFRTEGIRGFYRGLGASMLTWMPSSGIWWLTYEYCKRVFYPFRPIQKWSGRESNRNYYAELLAATTATTASTVLLNPVEIVKTRLQTQVHTVSLQKEEQLISNTFTGLINLLKEEGISAMGKGLVPRLIARVPLAGISAFIYEIVVHSSKKTPEKKE